MPIISPTAISPHRIGGKSWSAYWTALNEAMTSKPPAAYAAAANTFLKTLDNGGILEIGDRLFMHTPHTNANGEALLDVLHPTGTPAALTNGSGGAVPTFQPYNGFMGNIVKKSILNTQFNPASHGSNFKLDNATLLVYVWDMPSYATDNRTIGNHGSRLYVAPRYANQYFRGSCNSGSGNNTNSSTKLINPDIAAAVRVNATTEIKYKGDTSLGAETANVGASMPNANITLFSVEGTYFEDSQVSIVYMGGALTQAQITIFKNACDTFMNTISPNIDSTKATLSEADDLYAHESQILIKQIGGVDYLFMLYMSNKATTTEWQTTARAKLRIFNLSTLTHIRTIDLFYPGLEAGVTIPADDEVNVPRMYFYGADTLRCFCPNTSTLYTRDVTISDSNPANWVAGDISIAQMTMKDAGGSDVLVDVTSANIQAHLEFTLSESNALYNGLMPLFRNMDIAKSGNDWYATMELSGERASVASNIVTTLISADAGNTWSIGSLVAYTTSSRAQILEPSIIFMGTDLHIISRGASVKHYKSTDSGATWTAEADIPLNVDSGAVSKVCAINYTDGTVKNFIAANTSSQVVGNTGRTTLRVFSTADFVIYPKVARILSNNYCSYPSLFYYGGKLYVSYSYGDAATQHSKGKIAFVEIGLV